MSIDWDFINQLLNSIVSGIVILGVPVGLLQYLRNARRDRLQQEYKTYDTTDQSYIDFLKMCFDNPQLDIFDIADENLPKALNSEDKKKELIAFTLLFAVFERAYLIYKSAPSGVITRQWGGWEEYISDYCSRSNFQQAWSLAGSQFDEDYQNYMHEMIKNFPVCNVKEKTVEKIGNKI